MSKLPSMPFFVDAYLADTTHLSLEEHGAYLLLLMAMWRRGGAIPDDDKDNARMLGLMPRAWLRLKSRLMPMLSVYGSEPVMLTQKKLQKMWNYSVQNSNRNTEKARHAANERWQRNQILDDASKQCSKQSLKLSRKMPSISNKNISSSFTTAETSSEEAQEQEKPPGKDLSYLLETPLMKGRA